VLERLRHERSGRSAAGGGISALRSPLLAVSDADALSTAALPAAARLLSADRISHLADQRTLPRVAADPLR
jgi:hypothetical protein